MLQVRGNRIYRRLFLFLAQAVALLGTGLATVALGLLAYELAGEDAGVVLGTALAIKMVAYVGTAPVAAGFAESLPRHRLLRSEEHTSELQSLMRISYAVFCLKKKNTLPQHLNSICNPSNTDNRASLTGVYYFHST